MAKLAQQTSEEPCGCLAWLRLSSLEYRLWLLDDRLDYWIVDYDVGWPHCRELLALLGSTGSWKEFFATVDPD